MREKAGDIPENDYQLVSTIVRQTTGLETSLIQPISGLGMNNSVTLANTDQGSFVVRTNVESHLFRFQREAWVFEQLKGTSVLTPEVLGCGQLDSHSYSIARFIEDSAPIDDTIDNLRVWSTLGGYAAQLNKIREPDPSKAVTIFPMSWEEQVRSDIEIIFKEDFWIEQGILDPQEQELLRGYLLETGASTAPKGACQFDMTPANTVIQSSRYDRIYLLDLEWANLAPTPYYQLACIAAEKGPNSEEAKAFFEGYGFNSSEDHEELQRFTLYRVMRATGWARDRRPELVQENIQRALPIIKNALNLLSG